MNRLMNGRKLRLLMEPCYTTKAEQMREKSLLLFLHLKTRACDKSSRDVSECQASAEIGLGARSRTCPQITCSAETLLRSGVCLL